MSLKPHAIFILQTMGNIWSFEPKLWQDSDWEEVQAGDVETDQDLLYSAGVTSFGRSKNEHLDAMAKVFNEVWLFMCIYKYIYIYVYLFITY